MKEFDRKLYLEHFPSKILENLVFGQLLTLIFVLYTPLFILKDNWVVTTLKVLFNTIWFIIYSLVLKLIKKIILDKAEKEYFKAIETGTTSKKEIAEFINIIEKQKDER